MNNLIIREIKKDKYKILDDFLYEAIYIPKGTTDYYELNIYFDSNKEVQHTIESHYTNLFFIGYEN